MKQIFVRLKRCAQIALGVMILFSFFAGWVTVIGASCELYAHQRAQSWPVKRGMITHSYVRQGRGFQNRRYWRSEIAGVYQDGGGVFGANRYGYGVEFSVFTKEQAERKVARFPVGTELNVYHDPNKPGYAILVRDNSTYPTWLALITGLIFGFLPLGLYIAGRVLGWKAREDQGNRMCSKGARPSNDAR
jgi:hypothetical protein